MSACGIADDLVKSGDNSTNLNAKTICCRLCPSVILLPGKGVLINKPVSVIVFWELKVWIDEINSRT